MSKLFKSRVIVLRRFPFSEADEILSLLSPELGRFDAVVRASRKMRSSFIAKVEPFMELDAMFAQGKTIIYLTQALVHKSRSVFYTDYLKSCWGSYFLELFMRLLPMHEGSRQIYYLALSSLDALETTDNYSLLARWLELRLLRILGYQPLLHSCIHCGNSAFHCFSVSDGGMVCPDCADSVTSPFFISPKTLAVLRNLLSMPTQPNLLPPFPLEIRTVLRTKLDITTLSEMDKLLSEHLQYHCTCSLRSRDVLAALV